MRNSRTTPWNTAFFETILTAFPEEIRPVYIPFRRLRGNGEFFIRRAVFISITTPMQSLFLNVAESLLVKKTVYRHFEIEEIIGFPEKLNVLYIAREGRTRQILNENELLSEFQRDEHKIEITKRYFGNLGFVDQVKLMSDTDIVFGIHGAAFINILFMRPKSGLLEFFSPIFHVGYYEAIALKSNTIYDCVKNNLVEKLPSSVKPKKKRDPRNANLEINLTAASIKFSKMVVLVWENKYKRVLLV